MIKILTTKIFTQMNVIFVVHQQHVHTYVHICTVSYDQRAESLYHILLMRE